MENYVLSEVVAFKKVKDEWGGFSNMSSHRVRVFGVEFRSSEALYQCLRFSHLPDLQKVIWEQKSPMAAKMKSKPKRNSETQKDFIDNQLEIMEWCIRMKIACNMLEMKRLMRRCNGKVVENSHKDRFWGAVGLKENPEILEGENRLGKIWDKIIKEFKEDSNSLKSVKSLGIDSLKIMGKSINMDFNIK